MQPSSLGKLKPQLRWS